MNYNQRINKQKTKRIYETIEKISEKRATRLIKREVKNEHAEKFDPKNNTSNQKGLLMSNNITKQRHGALVKNAPYSSARKITHPR